MNEEIRKELELRYGKVWDTNQMMEEFIINGFSAPYVVAIRKIDNTEGSLQFTHSPRLYFNWVQK